MKKLPDFIPPMLAQTGKPFDSGDYLFEIKWDGTRALAFIDEDGCRLVNRRRVLMSDRYPDLDFLKNLPRGLVLDGEVVVLRDGKPVFPLLQSREQARTGHYVRALAHSTPATYIAFDVLYVDYQSVMNQPLRERRKLLEVVVHGVSNPQLVLSEGVIGRGTALFQELCKRDMEGMMAKRLDSRYLPGQRNACWLKIKKTSDFLCAIIGFVPSGPDDFRSLIIAAEKDGKLRCVGKVGSGFTVAMRKKLNELLWSRLQAKPICPCDIKGKWVAPGLFCRVTCMEQTENGDLRAPAFKELIQSDKETE